MHGHPRRNAPSFIYLFFLHGPLGRYCFSTRPGGERGEVGLRLTRPAPPQSSGPRRGPSCGRAPSQPVSTSPLPLPAGLSPEKLGTWGRGSPWVSRQITALRAWWAVHGSGGLYALHSDAPAFSGVRSFFPATFRVYQKFSDLHPADFSPPSGQIESHYLVERADVSFWGVGASHILGPCSWDGLFVPWPGELVWGGRPRRAWVAWSTWNKRVNPKPACFLGRGGASSRP